MPRFSLRSLMMTVVWASIVLGCIAFLFQNVPRWLPERARRGKTYFCGKKLLSPEFYEDVNVSELPAMMGDNQSAWTGFDWDNHRVAWNPKARWPAENYQPQQDTPGALFTNCFAFGSAHPGSLNMAYCDGSVQTVSYDIDMVVHRQMANRMDGN